MALEYTFTARVEGGRLKIGLQALQVLREALKGWRSCPVTVTVERRHAIRSGQANRYYWGVIVAHLSEHTGYTPEETHECLKQLFLPKKLAMLASNGDIGDELVIGGSTSKLNTIEFYEYCDRIREWARASLGVRIPLPEQTEAAS